MANEYEKRLPKQFEAIRNAHGDFQSSAFFFLRWRLRQHG